MEKPTKKRKEVRIVRVLTKRQKEFDKDNLYAGCKVVLDSLTREGYIIDDNPNEIDLHVSQRRAQKGEIGGTEIFIT